MSSPFEFDADETPPRRPDRHKPGGDWPLSARVLVWLLLAVVVGGLIIGGFTYYHERYVRPRFEYGLQLIPIEAELQLFLEQAISDGDRARQVEIRADLRRIHEEMRRAGVNPHR